MRYQNSTDFQNALQGIIQNALKEDVGDGDHSSLACIPKEAKGNARLIAKGKGIIAGVAFALKVFEMVDKNLATSVYKTDGSSIEKGDTVLTVSGNIQSILRAERLVLNAMQRMSGIATMACDCHNLIKDTKAQLLDTRKTTPNLRMLEKWAVRIGGGLNHRFGLYDMIMLKDNHIDFAGGIKNAIEKTKAYLEREAKDLKIIVEARNLKEVDEILACDGVHRILLDNFTPSATKEAVKLIGNRCQTESSGNINLETIRAYALCGVDYISCGALTHSIKSVDLSLKAF